jgi:hypothetical protein
VNDFMGAKLWNLPVRPVYPSGHHAYSQETALRRMDCLTAKGLLSWLFSEGAGAIGFEESRRRKQCDQSPRFSDSELASAINLETEVGK